MKVRRTKNRSVLQGNENFIVPQEYIKQRNRENQDLGYMKERKKLTFDWDNRKILIENIRKLFSNTNNTNH